MISALARSLFDPFGLTSHGSCPLREPWPPMPKALALLPWPALRWAAEAAAPPRGAGEACHRASIVGAPVPLHTLDAQGRIMGVSDRWLELMGYDRAEEVLGRHIGALEEPASAALIAAALERLLADGEVRDLERRFVRRDGAVLDVLVSARIERRGEAWWGEEVARFARNALDAAAKGAGLTAQLLAFARRQRLDPKPLDPVRVVAGMKGLLARTAGDRIALRVEAEEGAGLCLADSNQLESALLNLAINARDAIGEAAGTIAVSVRAERVAGTPEGWPPEGDYVRVAVRDDGPGMPEEVRRRACEPFFTTKAPGKGTGLGLAQIHGFAHQSGGTVLIDSAPGKGTEVAILLPRAANTVPVEAAEVRGAPEPAAEVGSGELVLVVEDEALVRAALAETLRDLGYHAVEVADADAALALLDRGVGVDAILSDVTMPGNMDGAGLAHAARARLPGLPVILATGRAGALDGRSLPPGVGVLRKPLEQGAIAAALRRALAGTTGAEPVEA